MTPTKSASGKYSVTRLQVSSSHNNPKRNGDLDRGVVEVDEEVFREEGQRAWEGDHAAITQDIQLGVAVKSQAHASMRTPSEARRERRGLSAVVRVRDYDDAAVRDLRANPVGHDGEGPPPRPETAGRGCHPTDRDTAHAPIQPDIRTVTGRPQDGRVADAGTSDLASNDEE
jgi:hypothetical protein